MPPKENKFYPPQWASRFLEWYCNPGLLEEIHGDAYELFNRLAQTNKTKADLYFVWNVIRFFRWRNIKWSRRKPVTNQSLTLIDMLSNYFIIGWRNLIKNKLHLALNILGLSIGISACLVIYSIASFELSFNKQVPDGDRIYHIYTSYSGAFNGTNSGVPTAMQTLVKSDFTGLQDIAAFYTYSAKVTVPEKNGKKDFGEQITLAIVDAGYFNLVPYQWIEGNTQTSLTKPFQVVLTEDKAKLYFGTTDFKRVIGQEVHYHDSLVLNVSGIVKPLPYNADFNFTDFISVSTIDKSFLKEAGMQPNDWESTSGSSQLFVKLGINTSPGTLQRQLSIANDKYKAMQKEQSFKVEFKIQPLSDLHFNSDLGIFDGGGEPGNRKTLSILSLVAAMLLLIACINFINLETAHAATRAKEVGVRKVLGSSRPQLIYHFLTQSLLLTFFATLVSLAIAKISLLLFSDFIPNGVGLNLFSETTLLFMLGIIAIIGFVAGSYPAFVMSSFLPALALKNQVYLNSTQSRTAFLRQTLITFQFAFAQVLIIATIVVISQINFMTHRDLGFDKEAIIHFHAPGFERPEKRFTLKNELESIPEIDNISLSNSTPSSQSQMSGVMINKTDAGEQKTNVYRKQGDENYIPLYNIKVIAGRNLMPSDSIFQIVINQTYLKELNLTPEQAIGKEVWSRNKPYTIVGVVKDFNTLSLHVGFQPVMLSKGKMTYEFNVKLRRDAANDFKTAISKIEGKWKKVFPDARFEYDFLDQTIANFYKTEEKISKLTALAMTIAIIICCLGLFGLVSFTANQRTKEIGIRKVLGATINNIILLLSTDFIKLVVIAFIIAAPIAYLASMKFLDGYAFHMQLEWELFAMAGCASIVLAFVTVSYRAVKAATANPVDSLRNE
jgi:putative ABC transport system permease protein